jgi:hypothetical protein
MFQLAYINTGVRVMVFNVTFNNISVISWQSILLVTIYIYIYIYILYVSEIKNLYLYMLTETFDVKS